MARRPRLLSLGIDHLITQTRTSTNFIDGGGIRGLSTLKILEDIMERIRREEGLQDTPLPRDYFDLIGGTNTGG
jgi:patatin-like phospholipase/acyl hydrolase